MQTILVSYFSTKTSRTAESWQDQLSNHAVNHTKPRALDHDEASRCHTGSVPSHEGMQNRTLIENTGKIFYRFSQLAKLSGRTDGRQLGGCLLLFSGGWLVGCVVASLRGCVGGGVALIQWAAFRNMVLHKRNVNRPRALRGAGGERRGGLVQLMRLGRRTPVLSLIHI